MTASIQQEFERNVWYIYTEYLSQPETIERRDLYFLCILGKDMIYDIQRKDDF